MKKIIIEANDLSINFPMYGVTRLLDKKSIKSIIGGAVNRNNNSLVINAIDKANFKLFEGDKVGLIGHNGAGKTTLLRALAKVYAPVSGSLVVNGKIASVLDLASGLDADATGYENIYIKGIQLGLTLNQISMLAEKIAAFSDLGEYLNFPLRSYSSGMLLRLAFSVVSHIKSDILLMDEWLSVGDAAFQEKATRKMNELIDESSLLVIASHSREFLEKNCNRIFRVEHGRITEEVI